MNPTSHREPNRLFFVLLAALLVLAAWLGARKIGAAENEGSDDDGPAIYHVRAEVVELAAEGADPRALVVHHEAIDDLVGVDGQVWGMDSMQMPFLVHADVSLDGLAAGDKVELVLAVDWFGPVPQQVVELKRLPAETELEFRPARPPQS